MNKFFFALFLTVTVAAVRAEEATLEDALRAVVENETKFFQLGQEQGTRAAFLAYLADDGIVFQPGPVNGKRAWTKRPEGGVSIKWRPLYAFISHSADLAYTTGPAEYRKSKEDEKPFSYGQYVSIWRKQKDGVWKVELDVGSELPGPSKSEEAPQLEVSVSNAPVLERPLEKTAAARLLKNAEGRLMSAAKTDSTSALLESCSTAVRVHREGVFPAAGKDAAALMLSVARGQLTLEKSGGGMSEAGDLAYSYGKYSLVRPEKNERGYYLQIWRTESEGTWKIALDYQTPLPQKN